VVADPDLDAAPHELPRDVGLEVGEADREVGLERQDLVELRRDERRDARLFFAGPGRADREAGRRCRRSGAPRRARRGPRWAPR
jgi:hypothetical protein